MACPGRSGTQGDDAWLPPRPALSAFTRVFDALWRSAAGRGCGGAKAGGRGGGPPGPPQPFPSPAGLTRGSIFFVRTFWRRGWIAPQLGLARVAQYDAPQVG